MSTTRSGRSARQSLLSKMRRTSGARAQAASGVGADDVQSAAKHEVLAFGDVQIDFTSMEAKRAGKPVTMTAQEFKLLKFFARTPQRVISCEELLAEVWGYQDYPSTRTVDNHILRLRQKLEPDPANPRFFLTTHGAGYKFVLGVSGADKLG